MKKAVTRLLIAAVMLLSALAMMSAIARKHVNKGLAWPVAWTALLGDRGWRFAMSRTVRQLSSIAEIVDTLGVPYEQIQLSDGSVELRYARPSVRIDKNGSRSRAIISFTYGPTRLTLGSRRP